MLLRSEDQGKFRAQIERAGPEVWASYSIEGLVNGEAMRQSDKQMFASEEEARNWLVGEGEKRGFHNIEPEIQVA